MNILHVIGALKIGGVEISVLQFLKNSANSDTIKNFLVAKSGSITIDESFNTKFFNMDTATENPLKIILNGIRLAHIIKKYKIDVIHAYNRQTSYSAYIASKLAKVTFVATTSGVYNLNGFWRKQFNKSILFADKIIATSEYVKHHIKKHYTLIPYDKIKTIYEGIDISDIKNRKLPDDFKIPENKKIIMMLARFSPIKGHELLIKSLPLVTSDYVCYLVGPTKNSKYVDSLVNLKNKLQVNVEFLNENFIGLINYADVIVCPSIREESFGRVAVEGELLKKIVIASGQGGHSEVIQNRKTGFLFFNNNHIELANILNDIFSMKESKLDLIKESAFQFANEHFTIEDHVKNKIDFYKTLIK